MIDMAHLLWWTATQLLTLAIGMKLGSWLTVQAYRRRGVKVSEPKQARWVVTDWAVVRRGIWRLVVGLALVVSALSIIRAGDALDASARATSSTERAAICSQNFAKAFIVAQQARLDAAAIKEDQYIALLKRIRATDGGFAIGIVLDDAIEAAEDQKRIQFEIPYPVDSCPPAPVMEYIP